MSEFDVIKDMLPVLIPLFIFQISFQIYCIIDLIKQEKVRFDNKLIWGAVIVVFSFIGGVIYMAIGRDDQ